MTDTPERIALRWQPGLAVTNGPLMYHPDYTQYVRADVAAAMVAAEREACAALHDEWQKDDTALAKMYPDGSNPWFVRIQRARFHQESAAAIRKRGQQ